MPTNATTCEDIEKRNQNMTKHNSSVPLFGVSAIIIVVVVGMVVIWLIRVKEVG